MGNTGCIDLSNEHIRQFQAQGFLKVGSLTTAQELTWLRDTSEQIIRHGIGHPPDTPAHVINREDCNSLVTVLRPEKIAPALKHTLFFHNARKVIARLMAIEESLLIDSGRLFLKLVGASETPWHQDAAYHPAGYDGASVWLSLSSATSENGCMHFIKGSQLGEIQPHSLQGDSLVASAVDLSQAVGCPLSAGEATVHHCRTLHYAGPNTSNQSRQALAVVCAVRGAD